MRLVKSSLKLEPEDILTPVIFMMYYVKKHMFTKGKVENFTVIMDLENASAWSLPVSMMKPFIKVLGSNFRCHTAKTIILNASTTIVYSWKAISGLLQESQRQKAIIVGENTCPWLKKMVRPDQLLKRHGGEQDDPESWWPPTVPQTGVYLPRKEKLGKKIKP